jgi:type VI secretion system secreted protein VgrG
LWCDRSPAYGWHGVAAEIELLLEMPERNLARIRVVPRFALLAESHHSRMFTNKSVPDVVRDVLKRANLVENSDFELRLSGSFDPESHVCQYHESDLAFIERWLAHEGIFFFFDHKGGCDKLVMSDDSTQHGKMSDDPIRYHPRDGHDVSAGESLADSRRSGAADRRA